MPDLILAGHAENAEYALGISSVQPLVASGGRDRKVQAQNLSALCICPEGMGMSHTLYNGSIYLCSVACLLVCFCTYAAALKCVCFPKSILLVHFLPCVGVGGQEFLE